VGQRLTLTFAFILMEALTFFVVGAVLAGATDHEGVSIVAFIAAQAGGYVLVRGLLKFEWPPRLLIAGGGMVSFLALLTIAGLEFDAGAFPPGWAGLGQFLQDPGRVGGSAQAYAVYGVILLCLAWARGVMVAQIRLERERVLRSFSVGVVVLVAALLFGQESIAHGAVNGASIPLVAFGLLTLALIHLRDARSAGDAPLSGPWLLIAAGTVGGLALAGAVLGVLPLGPMGFAYDHAIAPAFSVVLVVVAWIILIIAFPLAWLISLILGWLAPGSHFQPPTPQSTSQDDFQKSLQRQNHGAAAGIFIVLAKLLAVVLVLALISYFAYRLFRRLHRPPVEGEERDSLEGEGSLRGDLAALWRHLRPRRAAPSAPPEPPLSPGLLEVRRLYLRLLDRVAARGHPRPAAATPLEFEPEAASVVESATADEVTRAFVEGRYGLREPDEAMLERLRGAVERLN
jgi:hypothetical protein